MSSSEPIICQECGQLFDTIESLEEHQETEREEKELRNRLNAPAGNATQDLYVSGPLKTQRVMVKDEDVCLHCGLCAERCPTGAWDMQKFLLDLTHAGHGCRTPQKKAA